MFQKLKSVLRSDSRNEVDLLSPVWISVNKLLQNVYSCLQESEEIILKRAQTNDGFVKIDVEQHAERQMTGITELHTVLRTCS
jgi:hypothetical protein